MSGKCVSAIGLILATFLASCSSGQSGNATPSIVRAAAVRFAASQSNTRLWVSMCVACDLIPSTPATTVSAYDPGSGAQLASIVFDEGTQGYSGLVATSPDQKHVYASIYRGGENYVADINPLTLAVRYYRIPVFYTQGLVDGLAVSPDGTRLYVSTGAAAVIDTPSYLFVINTVTRTYAGTRQVLMSALTISPDGRTLYGQSYRGSEPVLEAIDTAALTGDAFAAAATDVVGIAVDQTHLYTMSPGSGLTLSRIEIYNTALPRRNVAKIDISGYGLALALDRANSRLYAAYGVAGGNAGAIAVIDTVHLSIEHTINGLAFGGFMTVDPITHILYAQAASGIFCAYSGPAYLPACPAQESFPGVDYQIGGIATTN